MEYGVYNYPAAAVNVAVPGLSASTPASVNLEESPVSRPRRQKLNRDMLLDALRICNNNRSSAADYLGISRRTLYRKLEEFGID